MEATLADDQKDRGQEDRMQDDLVEVTIKMPARLRDHLVSICRRHNLKLDDIVCEQIERWLLRQTITRLEAPEESPGSSTDGRAGEG